MVDPRAASGSESYPQIPSGAAATPPPGPAWVRVIDRVLAIQRPVVVAHVRRVRKRHPHATPEQLIRVLERHYLQAVTTGGAAVGATAMVPAIGTGITLALSGAETVGFLETTALFVQSVTEVHGITLDDPVRSRALVMTLMLGRAGTDLVRQFAGQAVGSAPARAGYWGEVISSSLPPIMLGPIADELKKKFVRSFAVNQGTSLLGKAIPFGIGAAIGGVGNHLAGRQVVGNARNAFGPAPWALRLELEPVVVVRSGQGEKTRRVFSLPRGSRAEKKTLRDAQFSGRESSSSSSSSDTSATDDRAAGTSD